MTGGFCLNIIRRVEFGSTCRCRIIILQTSVCSEETQDVAGDGCCDVSGGVEILGEIDNNPPATLEVLPAIVV
jgi:hypothetical protein